MVPPELALPAVALAEAGVSGFTVLLPAFADVSGLASVALVPAGFGGIALLPVAPGFEGALPPGVPEAAAGAPESCPGSVGLLDVVPALVEAAVDGGIALLPVAPGFNGASARTSCGRAEEPGAPLLGRALLPVGPAFAGSDLTGSDAAGPALAGSTFVVEAAADGSAGLPIALSAGRGESLVTSLAASLACSGDLPCSEDLPCSGDLAPSLAPSLGEVTGVRSIQPPHRRSVLP
ncbi:MULTISPECIES: hypothetical protein [Methylobacteriaceae]|uniref:hypothetical protein n=1 Tax=Methylobacteriaceae TaxID=119045 RepID=UPI00074F9EB0|nr:MULTISPECIES: hypothetical protein [Methylobacteriaceae]AMB43798.1 hypothetical protein Y590_02740 [Methylobacterium sp. AMS5]